MEMQRDMKSVMKYWMEGEINNFINLWILVLISLSYCYFAAKLVPKGAKRLLFLLPVVCLFFFLPLKLHSIHLGATTSFFLTFLANFKLLLLAFGHGPLSGPSISLPRFLALACLPINIQTHCTGQPRVRSSHNLYFEQHPNPKSLEKAHLYLQNGCFQENPYPKKQKSLEKSDLYPENGNFNENLNPKSSEKSQLYPQKESFQETLTAKSLEKSNLHTQNESVQENPNPKSLEKSDLYPQNGTSQEIPDPNSLKNSDLYTQNGNSHGNPYPKFLDKSEDYTKNGYIKEDPNPKSTENAKNGHFQETPSLETSKNHQKFKTYARKAVMLGLIISVYSYSEHMHPTIILFIYFIHIYFYLEIIQAIVAAMTRGILGLELEPQFKEPYLSSSLQDFWGGRWNLMVSRILRPTVYNPVLCISARLLGRKWATFPAVMMTFAVSGLMHELLFYYLGRVKPTWEITGFFLLHGTCLAVEIAVKKKVKGRFRMPRIVAAVLSVGFVMVTGFWLFFPQLLRCQALTKGLAEYGYVGSFLKDLVRALTSVFHVFYS